MIQGIYQGAAAMNALERWQSAIASNLASGSVAGYKKDETSFSSQLSGKTQLTDDPISGGVSRVVPQATVRVSDSPGALRQTDKPLDLAIQGGGYFQVQAPNGDKGFTRNGEFHIDAKGTLITTQGEKVLGEKGPITVDPSLGPVTVTRTGDVTQGETPIGKLALFDLSKSGELRRSGAGLLNPADGSTPNKMQKPEVIQGYVEESNVVPLQEMVNLISVSRAYEVSQKLITTIDQTSRAAIDTLGSP